MLLGTIEGNTLRFSEGTTAVLLGNVLGEFGGKIDGNSLSSVNLFGAASRFISISIRPSLSVPMIFLCKILLDESVIVPSY